MQTRRIVGVDLGIATAHTVVVCDGSGATLVRRRCRPTRSSLEAIEAAALDGAEAGTRLEVVMEPTGAAWLPVAVFFARRGHLVYRVSSGKAADLRKFLSRHAKTNTIDAQTLARVPIVDPGGLVALELPEGAAAALGRRVRAADRLTEQATARKVRLRELARQVMPMIDAAVTGELTKGDVAVLERYGDPRAMVRAGKARLTKLIGAASRGHHGADRADAWLAVATAALDLYDDDPAVPFADLAAEMASEARILRAIEAERDRHATAREAAYRRVDPDGLARSLPGIADIGGPVLVAFMGRPGRFPNGSAFKRYTGLAPRASETGESDRKGQPMSKAGSGILRHQLACSANTARRLDPQLAAVYYTQMVERGAHHIKAVAVVAARLAERAWAVMDREEPYVVCDVDGRPVSHAEAKAIIAERYQVPEEVRRRRRTRKQAGKAPHQVLEAHAIKPDARGAGNRGDLPRATTQPRTAPRVNQSTATSAIT
jgi:transposase